MKREVRSARDGNWKSRISEYRTNIAVTGFVWDLCGSVWEEGNCVIGE